MRGSLSFVFVACLLSACASDPAANVAPAQVQPSAVEAPSAPSAVPENATKQASAAGSAIEMVGSKVTGSHTIKLPVSQGEVTVVDGAVFSTDVTFDMINLESDASKLTGHLKTDDFFSADTFATSRFVSTKIDAGTDGSFEVTGDLTIKDITHVVTFPAKIQVGEAGTQVDAEFSINRQNWGINYPGKSDNLIRDDVVVRFSLQAN